MDAQRRLDLRTALRMGVGGIWIAGALVNGIWTLRHTDSLGDDGIAGDAQLGIYQWFFSDVVASAQVAWTVLLILGEAALGILTLANGRWARAGLWGGAIWSLWLFPMLWPVTIMMGPFALLVLWLARDEHPASLVEILRRERARLDTARSGA